MDYLLTRFTELFTIGTGFLIIRFARTFDDLVLEEHKIRFLDWLNGFSLGSLSSRLKDLNDHFISLFSLMYGGEGDHDSMWPFISLCVVPGLFLTGLLGRYFPIFKIDLTIALAVGAASAFFLGFVLRALDMFDESTSEAMVVILIWFSSPLITFYFFGARYGFIVFLSVLFFMFYAYLPELKLVSSHHWHDSLTSLRTFRIIATSIIAIMIGSFLFPESLPSMTEVQRSGWSIGSYILINLMVDSLSLRETRLLLGLSRGKSLTRLGLIIVLDIVLSAALFLALPFAFDELPVFLKAMTFHGPQPWLGILFWSTFATSIVFYVFIITSFVTGFLHLLVTRYVRLGNLINIEEQPFYALGSVLGFALILIGAVPVLLSFMS